MLHLLIKRRANAHRTGSLTTPKITPLTWLLGLCVSLALASCSSGGSSDPDPNAQFRIGGTISNLNGSVTLALNGKPVVFNSADLPANGRFSFGDTVQQGGGYEVKVTVQPTTQQCSVTAGSGTVNNANVDNVRVNCVEVKVFTIGGTVNGLDGRVILALNNDAELTLNSNDFPDDGAFTFTNSPLKSGTEYEVTVLTDPAAQRCLVFQNSTRVADADIDDVSVSCADVETFSVGGTVTGLDSGNSLKLALVRNDETDATDSFTKTGPGNFTFESLVFKSGDRYTATITEQPGDQQCDFRDGSETDTVGNTDLTTIAIHCVQLFTLSGNLSGWSRAADSLEFSLFDDSDQVLQRLKPTTNGQFTFSHRFLSGDHYRVAVTKVPDDQHCTATNKSGQFVSNNINNVLVNCVNTFAIGVNITGKLSGNLTLTLLRNGSPVDEGGSLTANSLGSQTFGLRLGTGDIYEVIIGEQPSAQRCRVVNGRSTVASADIVVNVECSDPVAIGGTVNSDLDSELRLALRHSANGDLLETLQRSSQGVFEFSTRLAVNDSFHVSFARVPLTQQCEFGDGSETATGTVSASGVNLTVTCSEAEDFTLSLQYNDIKTFNFSWPVHQGDTFYRLYEKANGDAAFERVQDNIPVGTGEYAHIVPLYARSDAEYFLERCQPDTSPEDCPVSNTVRVQNGNPGDDPNTLRTSIGFIKADFPDKDDWYIHNIVGRRNLLSISDDGRLLAVGAPGEDDNRQGVQASGSSNDGRTDSGAVYLYRYTDDTGWQLDAFIKAEDAQANDWFGYSVSLSGDGAYLAVGAVNYENAVVSSGKAYLYHRSASGWQFQKRIASNVANAGFGSAVALDGDGNTLVIGVSERDQVQVFERGQDESWGNTGTAIVIEELDDNLPTGFGSAVSLNEGGDVLAVGARNDSGQGGRVYVYNKQNGAWPQVFKEVKLGGSRFGMTVSLDKEGKVLAVGDESADIPINGNTANQVGIVEIFRANEQGTAWSFSNRITAPNAEAGDHFGHASLSNDGKRLAVGAGGFYVARSFTNGESSNGQGINSGKQNDNSGPSSGAAYTFVFDGSSWLPEAYIKAPNTGSKDGFGLLLVLSGDGDTLAVFAPGEDSNSTGVGTITGRGNNNGPDTGALYLY